MKCLAMDTVSKKLYKLTNVYNAAEIGGLQVIIWTSTSKWVEQTISITI